MFSFKKEGECYKLYYNNIHVYKDFNIYYIKKTHTGTQFNFTYNNNDYNSFIGDEHLGIYLLAICTTYRTYRAICSDNDKIYDYGTVWPSEMILGNNYTYIYGTIFYYCNIQNSIVRKELFLDINKIVRKEENFFLINDYITIYNSIQNSFIKIHLIRKGYKYKIYKNKVIFSSNRDIRICDINNSVELKVKKEILKLYKYRNNLYKIEYV